MKPTRQLHGEKPAIALALALIAFAAGFRLLRATLLPELPNFSPVMAIAVCGALVLPGALAFLVPLLALIGSDLALNAHYGMPLLGPGELLGYACYGIGVATGIVLRRSGMPATFGGVAANALLFYVVSNTAAWLASPAYVKSAAGWVQALTAGIPGFPPTWMFLGWSLASDLLFTAVFLGALHFAIRPRFAPAAA